MTLLSDGIDVFDGEEGNLVVYPDPQFVTNVSNAVLNAIPKLQAVQRCILCFIVTENHAKQ